jgi:hypothetical protein
VCTSLSELKHELTKLIDDYAHEHKQDVNALDWYAVGVYLSQHVRKSRYVMTKDAGFIDLKHFLRAASESNRWLVPAAVVVRKGRTLEVQQALGGNVSAFGVEDLPSNRRGADWSMPTRNMKALPDRLADHITKSLGGFKYPPPRHVIEKLNWVRNFSETPVTDPEDPSIEKNPITGIRFKSSGSFALDCYYQDALNKGGISGTDILPGALYSEPLSGMIV